METTNVKHPQGVNEEEDKTRLRIMQTGSNWTQSLSKAIGRQEQDKCTLCGDKETKDHIWYCGKLKEQTTEIDPEIAEADPRDFTPAMRMGVACAMNADIRRTYWGGVLSTTMGQEEAKAIRMCGSEKHQQ